MKKKFNKKSGLPFSFVMTAALLAACGGGGGSSDNSSNSGSGNGSGSGPVTPPVVTLNAELVTGEPGGVSYLDGQGDMARFYSPTALVEDSKGNIFVADNTTVRKITPDGKVSLFAGQFLKPAADGVSGDGTGTDARFRYPSSLMIDANDNLYVADLSAVRKITPAGVVSTIAPITDGFIYYSDTTKYQSTGDMVRDSKGNFYYFDNKIGQLMVITPDGKSFAFTNAGKNELNQISALAIDANDNIYVADEGNKKVIRVAPDRRVSVMLWGSDLEKTSSTSVPKLSVDAAGNIYLPRWNYVVKVDPALNVTTVFGQNDSGVADGASQTATMQSVGAMHLKKNGEIVFIDTSAIRKYDVNKNIMTIAGKNANRAAVASDTSKFFRSVRDMTIGPDQKLYIADRKLVQQIDVAAKTMKTLPAFVNKTIFSSYLSIAFDAKGNLLIADTLGYQILRMDSNGSFTKIGGSDDDFLKFSFVFRAIRTTPDGRIIVWDADMLRQLNPDGSFTDIAGTHSAADPAIDGKGSAARLGYYADMIPDNKGNMTIVEWYQKGGRGIRQVTKDGSVSLLSGSLTEKGMLDGNLADARFMCPMGGAYDDKGNLYIADECANAIRKISSDGKVSSLNVQWSTPDGKQYKVIPGPRKLVWSQGKLIVHADSHIGDRGMLLQIPVN